MKNKIVLYPILFALACTLFWTYKVVCNKQLISALHKNDLAKAELMLTLGADPNYFYNASNGSHFKLMSKSRKICNSTWNRSISGEKAIEKSKLLLQYGADINKGQCSNTTPLWMTVQNKNTAITALLLQQKNVDIEKENLLHLALKAKQWEQAKVLVEHGANVNALDKEGYTPLFEALEDFDTFIYLLRKGADPHYQVKKNDGIGTNILWWTLEPKYEKAFFYLVKYFKINLFQTRGATTLVDMAIMSSSDTIAFFLLNRGVKIRHQNLCNKRKRWNLKKITRSISYLKENKELKDCPEFIP